MEEVETECPDRMVNELLQDGEVFLETNYPEWNMVVPYTHNWLMEEAEVSKEPGTMRTELP